MAKPIKSLELHYPMILFFIIAVNVYSLGVYSNLSGLLTQNN